MPERGRPPSTEHIGAGPTLAEIDTLYRTQSRRVLATLIRLLGDFELAEEALHDAFIAAVQQWPRDGLPSNPRAWLVSAGFGWSRLISAHRGSSPLISHPKTRSAAARSCPTGPAAGSSGADGTRRGIAIDGAIALVLGRAV